MTFCGLGLSNAQLFELSIQEYKKNQVSEVNARVSDSYLERRYGDLTGEEGATTKEKKERQLSALDIYARMYKLRLAFLSLSVLVILFASRKKLIKPVSSKTMTHFS